MSDFLFQRNHRHLETNTGIGRSLVRNGSMCYLPGLARQIFIHFRFGLRWIILLARVTEYSPAHIYGQKLSFYWD